MSDDSSSLVVADSVSLNLITESISRALLVVAGLVSGAILVRTADITELWTLSDYAHLKVLMYWNNLISVAIIFGLTTAIVRTISSYTTEPKKMGVTLFLSILTVTIIFSIFAVITTVLAEQVGFLSTDVPETTSELRTMWILVLISLLPSAYITVAKSFFTGIQRMKRSLVVDTVYNGSRIGILLILFVNMWITLESILYMYLFITIFGFVAAIGLVIREARAEGISVDLTYAREVSQPLFRVAGVFLALSLIASFGNYVTPLLVDYFGTDTDMARYAIADSTATTLRAFLYAPYAVLLPNITAMYTRGENENLRKRFNDSNRILVPTLIFAFVATLTFGEFLLGGIYGVRALDTTGGISAHQFLMTLSPVLLLAPMVGIYSNVLVALDKMKALLILGALNVAAQVAWIIIFQPFLGVIALALLWVTAIPLYLIYHYYTRRTTSLSVGRSLMIRSAILTGMAIPVAYAFSLFSGFLIDYVVNVLSFIPFISTTTFSSLLKLTFLAPLWYVFLSLSLTTGVMRLKDIDNLKKFLRKVPPVWWVSRPLIRFIENFEKRRTNNQIASIA